jgi:hypothetical protein
VTRLALPWWISCATLRRTIPDRVKPQSTRPGHGSILGKWLLCERPARRARRCQARRRAVGGHRLQFSHEPRREGCAEGASVNEKQQNEIAMDHRWLQRPSTEQYGNGPNTSRKSFAGRNWTRDQHAKHGALILPESSLDVTSPTSVEESIQTSKGSMRDG